MLRSIGSATFLALLMAGCGGGGGGSASSPPPAPSASATFGGTVSGLVGSGLTLGICPGSSPRGPVKPCHGLVQVNANGTFTLPEGPASDYTIAQQPSAPTQRCLISADYTSVTVFCPAEYAYVTNAADNTLSSYGIDATSGTLAPLGPPNSTGLSPRALAGFEFLDGAALKRFVFVAEEGSNDVAAFAADTRNGALTAVPGSPFATGIDPQAMGLYGPSLVVANAGSGNVSVYNIDMGNGALTALPGSPVPVGKSPSSIVVDYNGFVFVANHGGSNDISAFYLDTLLPAPGLQLTPVPGSPFPAGGNPLSLAFGPGGQFLYAANPDATNPGISGFHVDPDTGALSPLSGSPFPIPVSQYIAADQTGAYLYVTSGANIIGYGIDANTGALTALPGFPVAAGANAHSITIDPNNQFLYVTDDSAANIAGFALDATTGALTPMAGSPFPAGSQPQFIVTF